VDVLRFEQLPDRIDDIDALEELLSRPSQALVDDMARLEGDLVVLGVGGKVGPTLARLAKRAAPKKRVIGVARFSDVVVRRRLEDAGVETHTCDLLERDAVMKLPDAPNVVYMAGKKFGTEADQSFAWAMNTKVPAMVAERYRASRIGWVNNTLAAQRLFGYPMVPLGKMIDWTADWLARDMPTHDKPTRFEVRDGRF